MKQSIRNRLMTRQRRIVKRIDRANWNGQSPMLVRDKRLLRLIGGYLRAGVMV